MSQRIAIVGGGIGGTAAALFLHQAGMNVTVYEQASELTELGAGILVAPNMVRLMRRLGVADALAACAVRLEAAWEFRRWNDGRVLFTQPMGEACVRLYGAHCYVVHRADLLALLQRALPRELVQLDHRCVGVDQSEREATLRFTHRSGSALAVTADVVVGADGIHSVVRQAIAADVVARFAGLCAFRCLVPAELAPELARRPVQTLWLGSGRHVVHYPISGGRLVNLVAFVPAGDWRTESWTADGDVADLLAEFATWDARVGQLITSATSTKRWAVYDRDPLAQWTSGRITLLGDAAHPMLPFFGQGAAQALEDAAVLAACLCDGGDAVRPALERYERIRRPRATHVQLMSRGRELENHLADGPEQQARDARLVGGQPLQQNAWLYGHDVEADLATDR